LKIAASFFSLLLHGDVFVEAGGGSRTRHTVAKPAVVCLAEQQPFSISSNYETTLQKFLALFASNLALLR
jgi:hypothetical protein